MGKTKKIADAGAALKGTLRTGTIKEPDVGSVGLMVVGTAPLILNAFPQKTIEQMLKKHMGITVQREKKKPREVIENATPRNVDGAVSLLPTAFKKAMLTGAASIKGLFKSRLMTQIFVVGQSIPIAYGSTHPRMDMVRTAGISRTPDVRFRPQFNDWSATLVIQFDETTLDGSTIIDLVQRAGRVGVGEYRPERNGSFGTFKVERPLTDAAEFEAAIRANSVAMPALTIPEWALDADIDPEVLAKVLDTAAHAPTNGVHEHDDDGVDQEEATA